MSSTPARALLALAAALAVALGAAGTAATDGSDAEMSGPGPMCCSG